MPGFDFSNYTRNASLHAKGVPLPKATSTGTTIVGCIYNGGVVIAAGTADPLHCLRLELTMRSQIPELPAAPSSPTRTARSFTTFRPTSGVPVSLLQNPRLHPHRADLYLPLGAGTAAEYAHPPSLPA